jgi:ABC-2 type transport system permease protein
VEPVSVLRTVIAREYVQRVRTKTFLISTLAAPILLLLLVTVPALTSARGLESESRVALVDHTGVLADGVAEGLAELGYRVERIEGGTPEEAGLEGRLEAGVLAGVVVLDQGTLDRGVATWRGAMPPTTLRRLGIQQTVARVALVHRLVSMEEGAAVAALLSGGSLRVERLAEDAPDEGERSAGIVAGFVGAFLLYIVLLVYGSSVLRAVLEEKTGRVVEVIISSIRPWQLMTGKIVGVGLVGLTQLAIVLAFGLLVFGLGVPRMLAMLPDVDIPFDLAPFIPTPGVLGFFIVCFFAGYFLYASLFAAVGAMCSTEEEAQQVQIPVAMLVVIPIIFLMPTLDNPDAPSTVALSLFPFFSPILMFARVAAGDAPAWQATLSVVLMLGTLAVTAWVAGRIYRTGILMQGKRPTLPELWRWIRVG